MKRMIILVLVFCGLFSQLIAEESYTSNSWDNVTNKQTIKTNVNVKNNNFISFHVTNYDCSVTDIRGLNFVSDSNYKPESCILSQAFDGYSVLSNFSYQCIFDKLSTLKTSGEYCNIEYPTLSVALSTNDTCKTIVINLHNEFNKLVDIIKQCLTNEDSQKIMKFIDPEKRYYNEK